MALLVMAPFTFISWIVVLDNGRYHIFILFIFMLYCYFIFGFNVIFQVLINKSKKDKCVNYILQISGNLKYLGRLSIK